jgi:hypothetical protein
LSDAQQLPIPREMLGELKNAPRADSEYVYGRRDQVFVAALDEGPYLPFFQHNPRRILSIIGAR